MHTDLIGKKYKMYEVKDIIYAYNSEYQVILQCIYCGDTRQMRVGDFKRLLSGVNVPFKDCICYTLQLNKDKYIGKKQGIIEVIDVFRDSETNIIKLVCKCDCGTVFNCTLSNFNHNMQSCGCLRGKSISKYDKDIYINQIFNNLKVLKYFRKLGDTHVFWLCECLLCGQIKEYRADFVYRGIKKSCGCLASSTRKMYKNRELIGTKINGIEILDIISNEGTKWVCQCPFCDNIFIASASKVVSGHNKSCGCLGKSYGEKVIAQLLIEKEISFRQEVSFDDLLGWYGHKLRYDFGILSRDKTEFVAMLEYDGRQHDSVEYQRIKGNRDAEFCFKQIQEYDKLKEDYALSHGTLIYRIKYSRNLLDIKYCLEEILKDLRNKNLI